MRIEVPSFNTSSRAHEKCGCGELLDIAPHLDCTLIACRALYDVGWIVLEAETGSSIGGLHESKASAIRNARAILTTKTQRDIDKARKRIVKNWPESFPELAKAPK